MKILFLLVLLSSCGKKASDSTSGLVSIDSVSEADVGLINIKLSEERKICDLSSPNASLLTVLEKNLFSLSEKVESYRLNNELDRLRIEEKRDHLAYLMKERLIDPNVLDIKKLEAWEKNVQVILERDFFQRDEAKCFEKIRSEMRSSRFLEVLRHSVGFSVFLSKEMGTLKTELYEAYRFLVVGQLLDLKNLLIDIQENRPGSNHDQKIASLLRELLMHSKKHGVIVSPGLATAIVDINTTYLKDAADFVSNIQPRGSVYARFSFVESLRKINKLLTADSL
ncbi:MAG: hypothetical protein ACLGG0_08655 [Bacteriovoracia bacterium]